MELTSICLSLRCVCGVLPRISFLFALRGFAEVVSLGVSPQLDGDVLGVFSTGLGD